MSERPHLVFGPDGKVVHASLTPIKEGDLPKWRSASNERTTDKKPTERPKIEEVVRDPGGLVGHARGPIVFDAEGKSNELVRPFWKE